MHTPEMLKALVLAEELELKEYELGMCPGTECSDDLVYGWDGKVWHATNGMTTILVDREALSIRHGNFVAHGTDFSKDWAGDEVMPKEKILGRLLRVMASPEDWLA